MDDNGSGPNDIKFEKSWNSILEESLRAGIPVKVEQFPIREVLQFTVELLVCAEPEVRRRCSCAPKLNWMRDAVPEYSMWMKHRTEICAWHSRFDVWLLLAGPKISEDERIDGGAAWPGRS